MFKSISIRIITVSLFGAILLVGCSKDDAEDQTVGAGILVSEASILQYVPADSPYVIANIEPLPDALLDKFEPKFDEVLQSYDALLREIVKVAEQEAAAEGDDSADMEKVSAVVDGLSSLMSLEGMRGAGFSRDSTGVFYGVGLLPVLRVTVSDGALVDAALTRIEEEAGEQMAVATIGDSSFRYVEADKAKILIATYEDQVVITLVPASFDDAQVGQILGLTLPEKNIAEAGVLQRIAGEYGYTSHFVGFIDIEKIVGTFFGGASGTDVALLDLAGDEKPELSDVCKAEITALAGTVPRIVMGYKAINEDYMESQAVIELRNDIAAGLANLPAAVPGLGGDQGGLMSFGLSLDVMEARNFYEARLDALEADPFECEEFAEFQAGIAASRAALQQPVPPMVYDFKGFLTVINDIEGLDLATNTPPTSVDGRVLLAMDNAPALLALGAMFSPELAGLSIEPDGKPVPFQLPQSQPVLESVHVALTDEAVAMSFGAGAEQELDGMLSADTGEAGTFMSFSMDASRYYAFIGEAMMLAEQDEENPMPPEFQAALNDIMVTFSDFYDRMSADIRFTERGIEIDSTITLKD